MSSKFRLLDRSTEFAAFLTSLLIALCITSAVTMAFDETTLHNAAAAHIEEIVVQG